jgi:hypothetical protein
MARLVPVRSVEAVLAATYRERHTWMAHFNTITLIMAAWNRSAPATSCRVVQLQINSISLTDH